MVFENSCEAEMKHIISEVCFLADPHQEGLEGMMEFGENTNINRPRVN